MAEPCPLCKSSKVRTRYLLTDHRIAMCDDCRFEFCEDFRGGGGEDGVFTEDYYTVDQEDAFKVQFEDYNRDPSADVFRTWLGRIEQRIGVGRILDVGSALGTFLKLAEDRGWSPQGVEISRFGAEFTRQKRGISVFNGDLEDYDCVSESFDAVTFWDSIEHVTHPIENLRTATRLLKPGGLMLLTTDNFDCLIADVARLLYAVTFGRLRYAMERIFIPFNRSYFTEATFRAALESCGLRVVAFEKMEYPLDKIRTNPIERLILQVFYTTARLLGRQAQITVLVEKPASSGDGAGSGN
jgi:SAM-dependent methyltransferase